MVLLALLLASDPELTFDTDFPEPGRLRQAAGKGQAEMAALVGSRSYRTWQNWEAGNRPMPVGLWELALLKCHLHPTHELTNRAKKAPPPSESSVES